MQAILTISDSQKNTLASYRVEDPEVLASQRTIEETALKLKERLDRSMFFKAVFIPCRTDSIKHTLQDTLVPFSSREIAEIQNCKFDKHVRLRTKINAIVTHILTLIAKIVFDIIGVIPRLITLIPRAIYNRNYKACEHPLVKNLTDVENKPLFLNFHTLFKNNDYLQNGRYFSLTPMILSPLDFSAPFLSETDLTEKQLQMTGKAIGMEFRRVSVSGG